MNRRFLLGLAVSALLAIGVYLYFNETRKPKIENSITISTSTEAAILPTQPIKETQEPVKQQAYIPVSVINDTGKVDVSKETYENPTTDDAVSFSDSDLQSRNPVYSVLLNGGVVGQITGYFSSIPKFSPTNVYLSFLMTSVCGANCANSHLYLVDLIGKRLLTIKPPDIQGGGFDLIESYVWTSNGSGLDVTAYSASADDTHGFYRTSAKQVWHYNLATAEYMLTSTL